MTTILNDFEEGTNGSSITTANSGGTGETAFDTVLLGTGATFIYDNTHAAHGTLAGRPQTGGTVAQAKLEWFTSLGSGISQAWFRIYVYLTALPTTNTPIFTFLTTHTGTQNCRLVVSTAGKIIFNDGANAAQLTSTTTVPTNAWFRIEGFCVGSATVGQLEFKLFTSGMDNSSPDETQTSAATLNTTGTIAEADYGIAGVGITNVNYLWIDDIGASTTGYIGAVQSGAAGSNPGTFAAEPGGTWLRTFRHPQLMTPPTAVSVASSNADIPVAAPAGSLTITQPPPIVYAAYPGQTWMRAFRHSQPVQPSNVVVLGPTADIPVGAPVLDQQFVIPPYVPTSLPGETWNRTFRHPQVIQPPAIPITLLNNFEGGVNGVTLIPGPDSVGGNTGDFSGNYFDDTSIGTGATLAFDATRSAHGIYSLKLATPSTARVTLARWTNQFANQTNFWMRGYFYFTAFPSVNHHIFRSFILPASTGGLVASVDIDTGGHLYCSTGAGVTRQFTFTNTIPLNQWFRVEANIIADPVNGYAEVRMFSTNMDAAIGSFDEAHSVSGVNTTGPPTEVTFGQTPVLANIGPFWADDVGVSNVTWLGPVTVDQSFGVTANVPVASTFNDMAVTTGASAANADTSVVAQPGSVIGSPPAVTYSAQPGTTWTGKFQHRQLRQPPSSVILFGPTATITTDASGAGVVTSGFFPNNADVSVVGQAGSFSSLLSSSSNVTVTANPGISSVNNLITPAYPGQTWAKNFLHPQKLQQMFTIISPNPGNIVVTSIAATKTTLTGTTATVTVSAPAGTITESRSILSNVTVTANVGSPVNALSGAVSNATVVAPTGIEKNTVTGTNANITVAGIFGAMSDNFTGVVSNVVTAAPSGVVSIAVNLHGPVAPVTTATSAENPTVVVVGVVANVTGAGIAGSIKSSPPPLPSFVQVSTIAGTKVTVTGVTATASITAPPGSIPRTISVPTSNIIVSANPGLTGQVEFFGEMNVTGWVGTIGPNTP